MVLTAVAVNRYAEPPTKVEVISAGEAVGPAGFVSVGCTVQSDAIVLFDAGFRVNNHRLNIEGAVPFPQTAYPSA
jgi:hypothetical protein